jgi:hypothetical protein
MIEVPLHEVFTLESVNLAYSSPSQVQGYLAHKKQRPPRILH